MTIDKFSEEIHLESSFIFFISEDRIDQCRVNIKTILRNETKNKNYFLVKECRAEAIDKNPFKNHSKIMFRYIKVFLILLVLN